MMFSASSRLLEEGFVAKQAASSRNESGSSQSAEHLDGRHSEGINNVYDVVVDCNTMVRDRKAAGAMQLTRSAWRIAHSSRPATPDSGGSRWLENANNPPLRAM